MEAMFIMSVEISINTANDRVKVVFFPLILFFFLIQLTNETLLGQLNGKPPGDLLQLIILQEEAEVQGKACQSCSISFKM